ncbi:MAG: EAL domain-containing protein [Lachnospiraceae bacterium]|nr:EAL domain-containing protein [Lachnospiraceae bacterium]
MEKNSKALRQLKKSNSWIGIILYVLISISVLCVLGFFLANTSAYILNSRLSSEYEIISYMAKVYEDNGKENSEKVFSVLDKEGRSYIIKDKDGNTVHLSGKDTCGNELMDIRFLHGTKKVNTYADTENGFISPDENGNIKFDLPGLIKECNGKDLSDLEESAELFYIPKDELTEEKAEGLEKLKEKYEAFIRLPLWMSIDIGDGSEAFIGKANFTIGIWEFILLGSFAVFIILAGIAIFIIVLVSIIRSASSQKKTLKLFYTDLITKGNNWMYFLIKGERMLKSRKSAKYEYAVVNLVFVNYTNYCVCHSVAEGEKVLKKVYDTICQYIIKEEICARSSQSAFALLMRYQEKNIFLMRIDNIMRQIQKIDSDHMFNFQAGVDIVKVYRNDSYKIARRKYLDLQMEYNNACAASATLSENDASGVAFFDNKLLEDQIWIDKVQERQRTALNKEEFAVYYQPKYDPSNDKLKGAEALVRWQSPEFGLVPPGKFIPIFEKNGFIKDLDHYMISHVARDQRKWLNEGKNCVPVSVNVSRAHFIESDLADQIKDIVDSEGAPRELIEIELTESAFFDDKSKLIATINKLKEYGFAISMDDFGSGYSSLNSLKDMPLDVLKLDAEFFRGEGDDGRRKTVVSETIKLAKSLKMKTVAEGVEVKDQVEFLADQGCDMIQGYYYDKPMPKDEFESRLSGQEEKNN